MTCIVKIQSCKKNLVKNLVKTTLIFKILFISLVESCNTTRVYCLGIENKKKNKLTNS